MSQYRIQDVHEFTVAGRRYLFGVNTGAIMGMEETAARVMDSLRGRPGASVQELMAGFEDAGEEGWVQEALEELEALKVVGEDSGDQAPGARGTPQAGLPPLPFPVRSLVCHLASDCNLRCAYCYAEGGSYGQPRALMDPEMACRCVDFLLRSSGGNRRLSLTFFGGEPLLNPKALQAAVRYGRAQEERWGKEIDFSLTTNATLLSEAMVHFLSEHRIGVTVSLDGPPAVNDRLRTFPDGRGSYQSVLPQVRRLLDHHRTRPVAARVTVTRGVGDLEASFFHLHSLGFSQIGFCPVATRDARYALSPEDLSAFLEQLRRLAQRCLSASIPAARAGEAPCREGIALSNLSHLLQALHQGQRRPYPCGAGLGLLGVDPNGEIYPCHRFAGSPDLILGRIERGVDLGRQAAFFQRVHATKRVGRCAECWLRSLCAGGCYFESFIRHGDPFAPNLDTCRWLEAWIEEGLKIYVTLAQDRPELFLELLED
ncbi:MAG: SPASM domain-containing protein [Candidatus Tectomicrobia bacterium]|uniref:SPASM domain-containing protein n=1 Tax=Tectimicrobiota bacterium TaxID=2528274 RepID=A0A932FX39_UNCTE|nr:SPASM domain-containing protein [Candidatus Tectomicrobia bacterium]